MKALKGFASFQPGTNFRAWMYRILRNTFLTSQAGLKIAQLDVSDDQALGPAAAHTRIAAAGAHGAAIRSTRNRGVARAFFAKSCCSATSKR